MVKSAKDVLAEAATQPNDEWSRMKRQKMLSGLCTRMDEFLEVLRERDRGPSIKEMGRVLDDLESRILKIRMWDED